MLYLKNNKNGRDECSEHSLRPNHFNLLRRSNMAKESLPNNNSTHKLCSFEGCLNKVRPEGGALILGLCRKHYDQVENKLRKHPVKNLVCPVESCKRKVTSKGFCYTHRRRIRLYGDPLKSKNKISEYKTPKERFWSLAAITADNQRCWEWKGTKRGDGYGAFWFNSKPFIAHRAAWYFFYGKHPNKELFLLHSCDNRLCVNPNHLREGTHLENMQDARERRRFNYGDDHHTRRRMRNENNT